MATSKLRQRHGSTRSYSDEQAAAAIAQSSIPPPAAVRKGCPVQIKSGELLGTRAARLTSTEAAAIVEEVRAW